MSATYEVKVKSSPVYELLLSFLLFNRRNNLKYLELGTSWISKVEEKLGSSNAERFSSPQDLLLGDALPLLIDNCPNQDSIPLFLEWLRALQTTSIYEILAPNLLDNQAQLLLHLEKERNSIVDQLCVWYERYYQNREHEMTTIICDSARKVEKMILSGKKQEDIVEAFACGLRVELPTIEEVHLIPSYHFRPLHTFSIFQKTIYVWYPALQDSLEATILKKAKGLSEKTRLDIVKLLSSQKLSFTDIVKEIGTAKGNVHHHLMLLRTYGLIRVHLTPSGPLLSTVYGFQEHLKQTVDELLHQN